MIKFTRPANLNGEQLMAELKAAGVKPKDYPLLDSENDLWLDIDKKDESKAATVIASHNGSTEQREPSIEQKLASVGINIDDLKALLGV